MPRSTYWGGSTVIAAGVWWFFLEFVKELLFGALGTWVTSRMSDDGAQLLFDYVVPYGPPILLLSLGIMALSGVGQNIHITASPPFFRTVKIQKQVDDRRYPAANLDEWRKTDPLLLWQASCLWKGINPRYPVEFDHPAYPAFSMLLRAAEHGELKLAKREPDPNFASSHVTRQALYDYARKKDDVPEFLKDMGTKQQAEIKPSTNVQSGTEYFSPGQESCDVTITAVDITRAVFVPAGSNVIGYFINNFTLRLRRQNSKKSEAVYWQVLEYGE